MLQLLRSPSLLSRLLTADSPVGIPPGCFSQTEDSRTTFPSAPVSSYPAPQVKIAESPLLHTCAYVRSPAHQGVCPEPWFSTSSSLTVLVQILLPSRQPCLQSKGIVPHLGLTGPSRRSPSLSLRISAKLKYLLTTKLILFLASLFLLFGFYFVILL